MSDKAHKGPPSSMRRHFAHDRAEKSNLAGGRGADGKLDRAEDDDDGKQDGDEKLEPVARRPHESSSPDRGRLLRAD